MQIEAYANAQTRALLCFSVGYAKNKAVFQSCGQYLCFQDAVGGCMCIVCRHACVMSLSRCLPVKDIWSVKTNFIILVCTSTDVDLYSKHLHSVCLYVLCFTHCFIGACLEPKYQNL